MFLAPEFFLGVPLKILNRHYKIWPNADHRAKFYAGRPRISEISRWDKKKFKKEHLG